MQTPSGKRRKLSELQIGEQVLTWDSESGELRYSEVLMFLDQNPTEKRKYLEIHTKLGHILTLTASHLVPRTKTNETSLTEYKEVFANAIEVNDIVLIKNDQGDLIPDKVKHIKYVRRTGVFAPLTYTGTLIVDNVVASCYAVINSQKTAHLALAPVRWYYNLKLFFIGNTYKEISSRTKSINKGIHWYAKFLLDVSRIFMPKSMIYP